MSDKVWVINEPQGQQRTASRAPSYPAGKNPALAFSLSLLFWGVGQIYNKQRVLGFLFILIMANVYSIPALTILNWEFITSSLKAVYITSFELFTACGILYLFGLILWAFSAIHAYYKASQIGTDSFQGINNRLLPPLCSFFIPGWGQFLNGQPKKGGLFLIFALAGHFVLTVSLLVPLLWPVLETDADRLSLEKIMTIAVVFAPLIFLMWGFGVYDAMRVCLDPVKKEPLRKRAGYAINRMRIKGWKNAIVSRVKPAFMLSLFLVLSLTISYYYFPQRDYATMLKSIRVQLSEQKMVLLPNLIDKFLQTVLREEPRR
jgi:TM2 domain-containing membrane protein YozV